MITFKQFLLSEVVSASADAGATSPAASSVSQSNLLASQMQNLKQKQADAAKQKAAADKKFDDDMQRSQAMINSLSEDGPQQTAGMSSPPAANPAATSAGVSPTASNSQIQAMKQKQQMSMKQKADADKKFDDEMKKNQSQMDAIAAMQAKLGQPMDQDKTTPNKPMPGTNLPGLDPSPNSQASATPSGAQTVQTIKPSARVGFGTSFTS